MEGKIMIQNRLLFLSPQLVVRDPKKVQCQRAIFPSPSPLLPSPPFEDKVSHYILAWFLYRNRETERVHNTLVEKCDGAERKKGKKDRKKDKQVGLNFIPRSRYLGSKVENSRDEKFTSRSFFHSPSSVDFNLKIKPNSKKTRTSREVDCKKKKIGTRLFSPEFWLTSIRDSVETKIGRHLEEGGVEVRKFPRVKQGVVS